MNNQGTHFLLDLYGCPKAKLEDSSFILDLLDNFPRKIKANKIRDPYVFKYEGKTADDWGLSGVALINQSHISVHTFPDKGQAFIDIFSCHGFDESTVRAELINSFEATHNEVTSLNRETHSYQDDFVGISERARVLN